MSPETEKHLTDICATAWQTGGEALRFALMLEFGRRGLSHLIPALEGVPVPTKEELAAMRVSMVSSDGRAEAVASVANKAWIRAYPF